MSAYISKCPAQISFIFMALTIARLDSFRFKPRAVGAIACPQPRRMSRRTFLQSSTRCNYHELNLWGGTVNACRDSVTCSFIDHFNVGHVTEEHVIQLCQWHYDAYNRLKTTPDQTGKWSNFLPYQEVKGAVTNDFVLEAKIVPLPPSTPPEPPPGRHRTKKLNSTIRTKCWQTYATQFIRMFLDDKWFQLHNPRDQPFCVIRCWCCGEQPLTHNGYTNRFHERSPTFECGHVYAQSKTGNDDITNLRPICGDCNKKQGTHSMYDFARACNYDSNQYSLICKEPLPI